MQTWHGAFKIKVQLELVSSRDEFHLKGRKISPRLKTLISSKLFLSLTLSVSTPSALRSSFSLPLSTSQLPLFLSLARSGGYGTPRYSSDHWNLTRLVRRKTFKARLVTPVTTGNQVKKFLSHLPFNFRNFGFGFGFPKVDFLQLVGLFLHL